MRIPSLRLSDSTLRKAEFAPAALLTLEAIWLRVVAASSVEALRRDEANTFEPVQPLEDQAAATLRSGNGVFIVDNLPAVPRGQKPVNLPAARLKANQWPEGPYDYHWGITLGYFRQQHSKSIAIVRVNAGPVSDYENLPLVVVTGWKP